MQLTGQNPIFERHRIHAIGGMAGIGKTTLVVHAAHQLAGRFPDGQIFLPLHAHTPGQRPVDPADALASLLLAAGISAQAIPPGLEPRAGRWRDHLAGKKVLLVLDDATGHEQVRHNLSANKTPAIRAWAHDANVELCLTPASASWANPIEAQSGPLRTFTMGNSDHANHTVLARRLQDYLRWRNANARHPDVLAAQRRERARIRSERQQRWGRPKPQSRLTRPGKRYWSAH